MKSTIKILCFALFGLGITSCGSDIFSSNELASALSDAGVGGSYARFLVAGDFMYIVDDTSLKTFDLQEPAKPKKINEQAIGNRIETIFRFQDKLFIGSGEGLFIFAIQEDGLPHLLSKTSYFEFNIYPCDPVVANAEYAYVTLNSKVRLDNPCGGSFEVNTDVLKIFDITDIQQPQQIAEYPMTAPKGVGLDGTTLFICDDVAGLKVFDVADPLNIQLIKHFDTFTAFDVIPLDGLLLVVTPDNVYQFDYTDLEDIKLVSTIPYGA